MPEYAIYITAAIVFIIFLVILYFGILKNEFKKTAAYMKKEKYYRELYDDSRIIITRKGLNNYKTAVSSPDFRYTLKSNYLNGSENKPPLSTEHDFDVLAFVKKQTPFNHNYSKTLADNWVAESITSRMGAFVVRYDDKDLVISDNEKLNAFYDAMKPQTVYAPEEEEDEE